VQDESLELQAARDHCGEFVPELLAVRKQVMEADWLTRGMVLLDRDLLESGCRVGVMSQLIAPDHLDCRIAGRGGQVRGTLNLR